MATTDEVAQAPPKRVRRIALVDDHPTLLRGIKALLSEDDRYEVVAVGMTADAVVELAASASPDIVITDLSMPGNVYGAIQAVARTGGARIIVFTAYGDVDMAMKALDAGAQGFVLKGSPSEDLGDAIEAVSGGELYVSPEFSKTLMAAFRHRSSREKELRAARLSPRERQLVDCLLEAKSNKEIGRTLNLTEKTVKHYMTNLMNKLGVRSRIEVVLAVQTGVRSGARPGYREIGEDN